MNTNTLKVLSAAAAIAVSALISPVPASAGGFIGDLIEGACGNCGVGRALDDAHRTLGNPLDHAGAAAAQYYWVPLSPHCATPWGIFVSNWQPIGFGCNVNGMQGVTVQ